MATYELDPDGLHDTARNLKAELAGLESPRAALSAAIDAAAGAECDSGDERTVRAAVDGLDDAPTIELTDGSEVGSQGAGVPPAHL